MLGNGEIGHVALGEVDDGVAPSPVYSATAEFSWSLSATADIVWVGDGTVFVWE
jgi:hypothetical protein